MRFIRLLIATCGAIALLASSNATTIAQDICVEYHLVPRTVFEDKTVTRYRDVVETVDETKQKTDYVPVYSTEKRERVHVSYKPVKKTTMRNEEFTVYKPIKETRFREETYEETDYETVTEMRKEKIVVEKPVTETSFREETVLVRKPVRKTEMKSRIVTTLRPVQTVDTQYVPGTLLTNQVAPGAAYDRTRLDWLRRGYYWDAAEGRYIWRRAGLHWTNSGVNPVQTAQTPVLIAQPQASTSYVPETTREETPVEILDYDEHIEVRKVPVEVQRTQETIEYRDVPVEVQKPITRTKTRRIPYEETRYEKVVKIRQVPVETTSYEKVEQIEPYERTTARWVAKTREVKVPRLVTRSVPYQTTIRVPRTVMMKVPVDQFGNVLGPAVPVKQQLGSSDYVAGTGVASITDRPAARIQPSEKSVLRRIETEVKTEPLRETSGRQVIEYDRPRVRPSTQRNPDDSIVVPETIPTYENAQTSLIEIRRRPVQLEETSGSSSSATESSVPVRKKPIRILGENEQFDGGADEAATDNGVQLVEPKIEPADVPPAIDGSPIEPVDDLDKGAGPSLGG